MLEIVFFSKKTPFLLTRIAFLFRIFYNRVSMFRREGPTLVGFFII